MIAAPTTKDWLETVTDFAVNNGKKKCFVDWPREWVRQYLAYHAGQDTLALVCDGEEVVALGTAIQCDIGQANSKWDWSPTNKQGDSLVILDVVSTRSGTLELLFCEMFRRWPPGAVKHFLARRHNRILNLSPRYIQMAAKN